MTCLLLSLVRLQNWSCICRIPHGCGQITAIHQKSYPDFSGSPSSSSSLDNRRSRKSGAMICVLAAVAKNIRNAVADKFLAYKIEWHRTASKSRRLCAITFIESSMKEDQRPNSSAYTISPERGAASSWSLTAMKHSGGKPSGSSTPYSVAGMYPNFG